MVAGWLPTGGLHGPLRAATHLTAGGEQHNSQSLAAEACWGDEI